jgi:hypothetical protein
MVNDLRDKGMGVGGGHNSWYSIIDLGVIPLFYSYTCLESRISERETSKNEEYRK